jgi:hypothetical protein
MQILRHSKICITMEIYTMVPDKATLAALKRLRDALSSPTPCRQMKPSNHTVLYGAALHGGQVFDKFSGAKGTRTPGLLDANQTLFQLSYSPVLSP